MARGITAAQFVHANMPLGTTFEAPALSYRTLSTWSPMSAHSLAA